MSVNIKPDHICLHAFSEDEDGDQSYTDIMSEVAGWCVYNFHEGQHSDPDNPKWTGEIDLSEEQDFSHYEEAMTEALRRSQAYEVEVQTY